MTLAINRINDWDNRVVTRFPRSSVVMEITPDIAAEMLTHNFDNRKLRQSTVTQYANDMSNGYWHEDADSPIVFDWNGRLINGQHRLHACIKANVSFRVRVNRGADPAAYDVMDQGLKRSAADALTKNGIAHAVNNAAAYRLVCAYRDGFITSKAISPQGKIANGEIVAGIRAQQELFISASVRAHRVYKERKYALAAVAAFYVIAMGEGYSDELVDEFMDGLQTGTNMEDGDPRLAFARWWVNSHRRNGPVVLAALIRTFNAYAKNQKLRLIKINCSGDGFPRIEPVDSLI